MSALNGMLVVAKSDQKIVVQIRVFGTYDDKATVEDFEKKFLQDFGTQEYKILFLGHIDDIDHGKPIVSKEATGNLDIELLKDLDYFWLHNMAILNAGHWGANKAC